MLGQEEVDRDAAQAKLDPNWNYRKRSDSYNGQLFEGISRYPVFRQCLKTVIKLEEVIEFYSRKFFSGFYDG